MRLALSLGRRGLGRTWPNPAVGCVIVSNGRVTGRGWTKPGGRPHAETGALTQAGAAANGAVAYVTLEPCAHHGQTPPCAAALIAAGIRRVVVGCTDPDARTAGKGLALLRAAGVTVATGCLATEAARDNAGFFNRIRRGRPLVTLKLAASFDGRIATAAGESRWITGPAARHFGHYLRATNDAVMVGSGTALADDPTLTVRGLGSDQQPVRIVCDTHLATPPRGKLGQSATDATPVWMCHGPPAELSQWQKTGAKLIACATGDTGHLDLADVMEKLADLGLTRLYCEGGGKLGAGLLAAGLVDQLVGMTAGLVLGAEGAPSIGALPARALADVQRFKLDLTRRVGDDVLHIWRKST